MNNFNGDNYSVQSNSFLNTSQLSPYINPRILYIRRLYFMMTLQLSICLGVSVCVHYFKNLRDFLQNHYYFFIICAVMVLLLMLFGYLAPSRVSGPPINWIYFFTFTAFLSFFLAYFTSIANSKYAVMVLLTANMLFFSLLIYALTTRTELTYYGASLYVIGASFLAMEMYMIMTDAKFMFLLMMTLVLGVFAFYIIYITQTTMQGIKSDFEGQDWIAGSCTIYLEIFFMFLMFAERLGDIITKERN